MIRSPFSISPIATTVEVPSAKGVWAPLSLSENAIREGSGLFSSSTAAKSVDQFQIMIRTTSFTFGVGGTDCGVGRDSKQEAFQRMSGGFRRLFVGHYPCDRIEGDQKWAVPPPDSPWNSTTWQNSLDPSTRRNEPIRMAWGGRRCSPQVRLGDFP